MIDTNDTNDTINNIDINNTNDREKIISREYITNLENFQVEIDAKYGKGEWTVLEYTDKKSPIVIKHKCGEEARYTRANSFSTGILKLCKKCQNQRNGRPRLTFEELDARIKGATYGTYELVSLIDSTNFIVNHKSCERKPFRTSVSRFFSRGQRCQCSKKMVVGKKTPIQEYSINDINDTNEE